MAIHYLFICWSMGSNYSSSLTENALLIQCHGSECGMKDDFQPLQELAAASSQESPRNPARLQGSQLVSQINYLGYRPTHTRDGNSGQCQLGGNLVPRPIILLLGILHGCWDCSMWGWGNSQIQTLLAKLHKLCKLQYQCSHAFFALLHWKSCLINKINYKLRLLLDF